MPRREQPDPYALKIGLRIQQLYKARHMTLEALADRCGLGKGHLSNIVHGLTIVTVTTLVRIAEGLEVSPPMLLLFPEETTRDELLGLIDQLPKPTEEKVARVPLPAPEKGSIAFNGKSTVSIDNMA